MTDWYRESVKLHKLYSGKLEIVPKVPVKDQKDFAIWYTPGVAGPSKKIAEDILESFELTWRWNTVAVISDGTRVLGLGNVGAEAALPVMEGKALLFKLLGGVDAIPIVHRACELEQFLWLLKTLEPSFGGYNLEDIESPKCFALLERARNELDIPIWHDDQQGTATIVLAALLAATKLTGLKLEHTRIVLFGVGAANIALYNLLKSYGVNPQNIIAIDSRGVLHPEREDITHLRKTNPWKY
ncbi:MAG TPA: NADP-dependent malic enzyme, partial [Pyrodictium sp.]|nr:NADP-dependent malic enzyme [Pyrodictium sp.]